MTKNDLIELWRGAGKDVKTRTFFYSHFKAWLDKQPPDDQNATESVRGTRTLSQNAAIHLWLEMVADALDREGHTVQDIVQKITRAEIRPNKDVLKEVMWRPYQLAATKKESSTELNKSEVSLIYDGLNKWLSENFELSVPFPSDEGKAEENLKGIRLAATERDDEYPEYQGPPTI